MFLAGESGEIEQFGDAGAHRRFADAEVTTIDGQVLMGSEIRVEVVELGNDADAGACRTRVGRNGPPGEADRAAVGDRQSQAAAQRRRLAGTVRAEEPETRACGNREVDAGDHRLASVGLAQGDDFERRAAAGGVERSARDQCRHARLTISRITCRRRWKKWSAPGTTITGNSSGFAHSMTLASGTVVSSDPWMTMVSPGTALVW